MCCGELIGYVNLENLETFRVINSSNISLPLSLHSCWNPITYMLECLILSHRFLKLCYFSSFFFLSFSNQIISTDLFSNSLTFFAISKPLLRPPSEFFILFNFFSGLEFPFGSSYSFYFSVEISCLFNQDYIFL